MKKTSRLLFAAMIIVAMAATLFVGCKKEKDGRMTETADLSASTNDNMDAYLMTFKKKLLSAEKGGETISLEQAERDLGNLLNFDFGDANYATNVFHHDTLYAYLSLTNDGKVDLSQLASTYQDMVGQIRAAYHLVDLPEKSVYTISCTFNNEKKGEDVDVTTVLTTRAYEETTIYTDDDWRAGDKAGRCDGTMVGIWGAPEEVEYMLQSNIGTWGCENGGRVYFTDEGHCWIRSIDLGMQDPNSPSNRRLFYRQDPTGIVNLYNTCLLHSEIVYYYNQARNLHNTCQNYFSPNPFPSGHVATDYRIDYEEGVWNVKKTAWWKIYIWHGKLNCSGSQPNLD